MPSAADQAILHRLMAEGAMDRPLLPQPGDIWVGVISGTTTSHDAPVASTHETPVASAHETPAVGAHDVARRIVPAAARTPVPQPVAMSPRSGVQVQLAAAENAQGAMAAWQRLRQRERTLTEGHAPAIMQATVKGRLVWRLRAGGFADAAGAGAFCARIRAAGGGCFVVAAAGR
jgi:cell division septation protein DedD